MATNPFTRHPREVGETYPQHMRSAAKLGGSMVLGGLCVLVHAVVPFLFVDTGSRTAEKLHRQMERRRARADWERHPII